MLCFGVLGDCGFCQNGDPGFVSETTGKPAHLFHIAFPDNPNHPYYQHLLNAQDLEEYEVVERLVAEGVSATLPSREGLTKEAAAPDGKKRKHGGIGGSSNSPKRKKN